MKAFVFCCVVVALSLQLCCAMRTIATGFTWAENIEFDKRGNLWVSDTRTGYVYRVSYNGAGAYYSEIHFDQLGHALGLTVDWRLNETAPLYVVGRAKNRDCVVAAVDTAVKNQWRVVATLPTVGNGMRMHHKTGLLYVSSEGNFLPGDGRVWRVNVTSGQVQLIKENLWAADGLWIDDNRNILYVGELFMGTIWAYDLLANKEIGLFKGLKTGWLDDFCLTPKGNAFIGANYGDRAIDLFSANSTSQAYVRRLQDNVKWATSVRWGKGYPGFPSTSLFITEGGGMFPWQKDFRLLEIQDADKLITQPLFEESTAQLLGEPVDMAERQRAFESPELLATAKAYAKLRQQ